MPRFTIGIEEEYQIIDPETRALRAEAVELLDQAQRALGDGVHPELRLSQVETASPVCESLADVRAALARGRQAIILAASETGSRVAAGGTHPFSPPREQPFTPKERYQEAVFVFGSLAHELVIFGCHVHTGLDDPEGTVQVMNRARVWLPPLLALSANSPFWMGQDTGYDSFRTQLYARSPTAGPPHLFASRAEYEGLLQALIAAGAIQDETRLRWDIRLPERVPTVEFRVCDVCPTINEAVMIAGLVRALARTCYEGAMRDEPYCRARPELLRAAQWQAARYGLGGELIDVHAEGSVPAAGLVESLVGFVRPDLEGSGDWDEVSALVRETLQRGNGASRQRAVYQRTRRLEDVVDFLVGETAQGTGCPSM
jgi:glutamate---cysteine ligase / carboxylate-amine ligase